MSALTFVDTEDLQANRTIADVTVVNPFAHPPPDGDGSNVAAPGAGEG